MKKLKFIETDKGSHFEYHLPCRNDLLEKSLFYKKFELEQRALEDWNQFLWDYGITDLATNESSLLYSIIIKTLSNKDLIDIATFGDSKDLKKHLAPVQLEKIEWKNSIEFTTEDPKFCRQYGYQTPAEFLNEMNYSNRSLNNRGFKISRVRKENLDSFIKTYNSDVTSWTFFLNSDWNGLIKNLQNTNKRPEINKLLELSDCIIDIQIGDDEGYLDYVLIQSKIQLKEEIKTLEESLTRFGEMFEGIISDLTPIDQEWKIDSFKKSLNEIKKIANTV